MNNNLKEKEAQQQGKTTATPKKKNFLVGYSIALFIFAGVLIGLSYLSQSRTVKDTDKIKQEIQVLSQNTEISADMQTRIEKLLARNDELENENTTLSEENEALKEELETLENAEKKAAAAEYMWQIEKAVASYQFKECSRLINEIDNKGLRPYLSSKALSELKEIEEKVK